jgi:hypothetical protein
MAVGFAAMLLCASRAHDAPMRGILGHPETADSVDRLSPTVTITYGCEQLTPAITKPTWRSSMLEATAQTLAVHAHVKASERASSAQPGDAAPPGLLFLDGRLYRKFSGSVELAIDLSALHVGTHSVAVEAVDAHGSICAGRSASPAEVFYFRIQPRAPPEQPSRTADRSRVSGGRKGLGGRSWATCSGVDGSDYQSLQSGTCLMRNVCYDTERESWIFYRSRRIRDVPLQFDRFDNFELPELSLKPSIRNLGAIPFKLYAEDDDAPAASDGMVRLASRRAVLYFPLAPHAWGLTVAENLWAVFMMQFMFGEASYDTQVLLHGDCEQHLELYAPFPLARSTGCGMDSRIRPRQPHLHRDFAAGTTSMGTQRPETCLAVARACPKASIQPSRATLL